MRGLVFLYFVSQVIAFSVFWVRNFHGKYYNVPWIYNTLSTISFVTHHLKHIINLSPVTCSCQGRHS